MKRLIKGIGSICLVMTVGLTTVYAETVDELKLYMGVKTEYVYQEEIPVGQEAIGKTDELNKGYKTYTTKESSELITQALSENHPRVTEGYKRQESMEDLLGVLESIKSATDILTSRGREDLIALGYIGGYVAPKHTYIAKEDEDGELGTLIAVEDRKDVPVWATSGNIGRVGTNTPKPVDGKIKLLSVYGESYILGSSSYGMYETVYDTSKGERVVALFNGFISYADAGVVELTSYDQRLKVRYVGAKVSSGLGVGSATPQGTEIGTTTNFSLGVSMSIDEIQRNILEVYTERESKEYYSDWAVRNPNKVEVLVLGPEDSNYHRKSTELDPKDPLSYTNPDEYGINPNAPKEEDDEE